MIYYKKRINKYNISSQIYKIYNKFKNNNKQILNLNYKIKKLSFKTK